MEMAPVPSTRVCCNRSPRVGWPRSGATNTAYSANSRHYRSNRKAARSDAY